MLATQREIQIKSYKVFPTESIVQTIIRKGKINDKACTTLEETSLLCSVLSEEMTFCYLFENVSQLSFMNVGK